jgi:DNA repair exonuclease SbcCD ATPase subunit
MKISDVLTEAGPTTAPSNVGRDYINMLNFVKSSGLEGVPADQQVAVALFKELQKQQQKNTQLGRELSAAEKRIDQATQSGELYGQELATHQAELERERGEIDRQREKMGQIDQQYASRAQASEQQMRSLTDQLTQLKTKPGVDKSTAETLQNQIEKLKKEGIGQDKFKELQKNIESIQNMQQVDDSVIQDLVAQIKSAESAATSAVQTKQELSRDLEQKTQTALDQVAQMRQDLEKLQQVEKKVASLSKELNDLEIEYSDTTKSVMDLEQNVYRLDTAITARNQAAAANAARQMKQMPQVAAQAQQVPASIANKEVQQTAPLAESRFGELIRWATK